MTQTGAGEQFDVYADFNGNVAKCVLDSTTLCEVNPLATDTVIDTPVTLPAGYQLLQVCSTPTACRRTTSMDTWRQDWVGLSVKS